MTGVSLDPDERDIVLFQQRQHPLPEIDIQRGLLVGLDPTLFLPAVDQPFVMLSTT